MLKVLDESVVGLLFALCGGYALASLGPRSLRRRLYSGLAAVAEHARGFPGARRAAERLRSAASAKAGACGGCDTCGTEPASLPDRGAGTPPRDIVVPVGAIGRRVDSRR